MNIDKIISGRDVPHEINVIIEVAANSLPVKYEYDKDSNALVVDRFLSTSMFYPCNYGFIPHTLSDDGDPSDVLVVTEMPLVNGCVIACRPIGVLIMEDESGEDEKILAVPVSKLTPYYDQINSYLDLPEILRLKISHFFTSYKQLEKNKWAKVTGWEDAAKAKELIVKAMSAAIK